MKIEILNSQGEKVKEKETILFEEPIREDIICKVVEAEKIWQPYATKFRAGMDISASGNITHRRHVWKTDRGKGLSRIPRKIFWRRGTQFSWEGAIVPSAKGGRRAHPPKGKVNLKKINKKELRKAFMSALSYISKPEELKKKYASLEGKKIKESLPIVIESKVLDLKGNKFLSSLKHILGESLYSVAIQKKTIRAGIGKMRGRKYQKNAGVLLVVGKDEDKKTKGIEIVETSNLIVRDLASNGARIVIFSENAIEELEKFVKGEGKVAPKGVPSAEGKKKVKVDKRKIRSAKNKKKKIEGKSKKVGKSEDEVQDKSEGDKKC